MTRYPNGPFAPPRDWDALRRAYESCTGDFASLAIANGLKPDTLRKYAQAKGWAPQLAATPPPAREPKPPPTPRTKPRPPRGRISSRRALLDRLLEALVGKVEKMETDMEAIRPMSAADHERHSRALATLVKSVENVDELSATAANASAANGRAAEKPGVAPETAGHDAEKLRRELAARIQRLRERLAR